MRRVLTSTPIALAGAQCSNKVAKTKDKDVDQWQLNEETSAVNSGSFEFVVLQCNFP